MPLRPIIEFQNLRDPKGYRLIADGPSKRSPHRRVVRNGRKEDPSEPCRPLDQADLFLIFTKRATTADGVLAFIEQYGPLALDPNCPEKGDDVTSVMSQAHAMLMLLGFFNEEPSRPPAARLRGRWVGPAVNISAAVVWDPLSKALEWRFTPFSLLDGLWLQFGQALTRGTRLRSECRSCEHCGSWVEAGAGTGRRLDAKFCSDEHRIAFNSLKRSRESSELQPRKGRRK